MFRITNFVLIFSLVFSGSWFIAPTLQAAGAEKQQTVTLDVKNMTCAIRPITVPKALEKVPGVIKAEAKYEGNGVGWAKVTFDPDKTGVEALTKATANAGYPSSLKIQ
ncbi:MAG: mercuric transport protein periplasmic component [Gammaproteobacteria bacterium]|nr:mercuric transport protein periplasmic component [Gammaproteobacteria bacterium]NIR28858.1 mercuric transport protein periplasmic component [Gammaproteobacteria bacterium]NIR97239.1 mercuric transport protein periplasmic component [Gammaproteobacteria bacterium]NIT62950.1 mercuric transport protein periplasmic component [Gammaproteobacteria bacterium]NIV20640.1 mercuric transport protein periplasmic component [Gammaproteobacteria bacterium]